MAIYLQYAKIEGDVTEAGHEKWIEIQGLQWGVGRGIHMRTGKAANREASAPSVSEVSISKAQDCASIDLMNEALFGKGEWAEIHFTRTEDGKPEVYLKYLLENCLISGYSVDSHGERPSESLSLNFTAIECCVTPMGADGTKGDPKRITYDLATATAA